jgi:uncharacterized protein YcbX
MSGTALGRIERLMRYPVKSMRGEELQSAQVTRDGVRGDRVFAFVDPAKKNNFPWVSARQVPEMLLFRPRFLDPEAGRDRIEVTTPEGETRLIDDPAFLTELESRWQRPLILRRSERGMPDSHPLSVFGMATLAQLSARLGSTLDPLRFRANLYVEWADPSPLFEESLLGKPLRIGDRLKIEITQKDPRCTIVNLEPSSAVSDPRILQTVGKSYGGRLGVYAVVLEEGVCRKGDAVELA